jgi:large subunit ribosomal protein L18
MSYARTIKRIRQGKTNYRKRASLLISRRTFITVKVSNQNIIAQVLKPTISGDIVIASAHSRELLKYGWKGSMNSMPACYLTGILIGKKSVAEGYKNAILYTGKSPFTSRISACLKGIVAAGVDVPVSESSLPKDNRINGEHIAEYAKILKRNEELYNKRFSLLLKNGLKPEEYPSHLEEIKMKVSGKDVAETSELREEKGITAKE